MLKMLYSENEKSSISLIAPHALQSDQSLYFTEPVLKLKIDGALLDNDDPLLAVVPPGTVEIESEVLRYVLVLK